MYVCIYGTMVIKCVQGWLVYQRAVQALPYHLNIGCYITLQIHPNDYLGQCVNQIRPLVALQMFFFGSNLYDSSMLRLSLYDIYLCCIEILRNFFLFFVISLGRVTVPSPKIVINLPGTYE